MKVNNNKKKTAVKQKYFDICDPREINNIVQQFIMALIWGFGAPLMGAARPKYSLFLNELIPKLFSANNSPFEFKKRIEMQLFPKSNCNLFSIFFSSKDSLWHKWDYEIDQYDILGDKLVPIEHKDVSKTLTNEMDDSVDKHNELSPTSGDAMA